MEKWQKPLCKGSEEEIEEDWQDDDQRRATAIVFQILFAPRGW